MALPEYNNANFEELNLRCHTCGWQGQGWDAVVIDLFGVTKSKEVHCPECDEKIGLVTRGGGTSGESANDFSYQTG